MDGRDEFDSFRHALTELPPDELAEYLTQLQANLDLTESRSEALRTRIEKLEADRETLRGRLDEARKAARRRGLGRFRPRVTSSTSSELPQRANTPESHQIEHGRRDIKVATILDPISTAVFDPEFTAVSLHRASWRTQLADHEPEMLFVESAFSGVDGSWTSRIAHFGAPHQDLVELVTAATDMGIPTVFWNKEDPINYGMFVGSSSLFDQIFTVDASVIDRYRSDLGHNRVGLLPFAAQPSLHAPPSLGDERTGAVAFAGSYYAQKHPERRKQMEIVLTPALDFGLDIYDRMDHLDDPRFEWPERYTSHIVGSVPYRDMGAVYRRYKVFLNVNTVTGSPTMCSRRVFELAACGTTIVTGPSAAITALVPPGIAHMTHDADETLHHLQAILNDPAKRSEAASVGPQWIHDGNTYSDRVATILLGLK